MEVFHAAVRKEKETQTVKEKVKLSLFVDDIMLYRENLNDATRKLLEFINEFRKVAEYIINIQNCTVFLHSNKNRYETEIKETIPFTII